MKKSTKNFKTPLHLACSKYNNRLNNVYFDEGYAVATDAHLLVRQSLKLHNFTDNEIKQMNGKGLNYGVFKMIYKADFVIVENGVLKADGFEFPLQKIDYFPNYKAVIPSYDDEFKLGSFGIDLKYMELVRKLSCGHKSGFSAIFPNETNMLIKNYGLTFEDELFLLMLKH